MLDLWLNQEAHIEKTASQQFEELAEKIAVAGPEPGSGLESVKPDGHKWESSNYSEEVGSAETADQLLQRELTGRVVDEVPKTNVQQTPPRAVNTLNGRADDRVPTVEKIKKVAAARPISAPPINKEEEISRARLLGGIGGGTLGALGGGGLGAAIGSMGGNRGKVIGGLTGALAGGGLGAYLGGRHGRLEAEATPEEVFQAKANLREAESRYGRGDLEDKARLRATLLAGNSTMRGAGRDAMSSDYLARDRPGRFVPEYTDYGYGSDSDPYHGGGGGGLRIKMRYRRVPQIGAVEKTSSLKQAMMNAAFDKKDANARAPSAVKSGLIGAGLGAGAYLGGQSIHENLLNRAAMRNLSRGGEGTLRWLKTGPKLRRAGTAALVSGGLAALAARHRRSKVKTSSLKETMMKVAADGQVQTLEGWGTC